MNHLTCSLSLAAVLSIAASSPAEMLSITNPSFEEGAVGNVVTGWSEAGGGGAHQAVTTDPSIGAQAAQMRGQWTWNATRGISQTLGDTVTAGKYTLTFDAKKLGDFDTFYASLYATGPLSRIGQADFALTDDYESYVLTQTIGAGDPAIGQPLGIFLSNAGGVTDTSVDANTSGNGSAGNLMVVDNVQLQYSAVPEPASGLVGLALIGLAARRRRVA